MTPQAQRIAIAEFCGFQRWEALRTGVVYLRRPSDRQAAHWLSCGDRITTSEVTNGVNQLPDYCNSLDAIAQAEARLTSQQLDIMHDYLWRDSECPRPWRATAAQRSEALLRTIGKWTNAD